MQTFSAGTQDRVRDRDSGSLRARATSHQHEIGFLDKGAESFIRKLIELFED